MNILFQEPLIPVGTKMYKMLKQETLFLEDSYDQWTQKQLLGNLLDKLLKFSANEKDFISEETIELLEPYLLVKAPDG